MSLINQMLQDLDKRAAGVHVLPDSVRPLPPARRSFWPGIAFAVVIAVIVGAAATMWFLQRGDSSPATVALAPPPAPVPAAKPPTELVPLPAMPAAAPGGPQAPAPALVPAIPPPSIAAPPPAPAPAPVEVKPKSVAMPERAPARASVAAPRNVLRLETALSVATIKDAMPAAAAPKPPPAVVDSAPSVEKRVKSSTPGERADAEYRQGLGLMQQGRSQEARARWLAALNEDPVHAAARQGLIGQAMELKRYDEAEQLLRQGLDALPGQTTWASTLARLRVERGDAAGALDILARHAAGATTSAEYQGFMGAVLQRLARHKEAEERYQAASRLAPADGRWWLGLGMSLEGLGRTAEARSAFQRARASGNLTPELAAFAEQKAR